MKKLQNNFTTPEQSKRLLELGVPADSADCFRTEINRLYVLPTNMKYSEQEKLEKQYGGNPIPCWSVGRLIEIMTICNNFGTCTIDWMSFSKEQSPLQTIYDELCAGVTQSLLDFSKLDE